MNEWVNERVDRVPPTCQSVNVAVKSGYFFSSLREGFGGLRVWVLGVAFILLWSGVSSMVGCGGILYATERLRGQSAASSTGRCPGEGNSLQTPVWTQSRDWHVFSVKGQAVNILLFFKTNSSLFLIEVMLVYDIT